MANENKQSKKQQDKQPSDQLTTPVAQVELTEEELEQVVGGCRKAGGEQLPTPDPIFLNPNPTAVE